jgi:hypothetical protein
MLVLVLGPVLVLLKLGLGVPPSRISLIAGRASKHAHLGGMQDGVVVVVLGAGLKTWMGMGGWAD